MASTKQITGGTKDVNPQLLSGFVTMTAPNVQTVQQLPNPVIRLPTQQGAAIVLELLKVYVDFPPIDVTNVAATRYTRSFVLATYNPGVGAEATLGDPRVVAKLQQDDYYAFTAGGTGGLTNSIDPHVFDLTYGAGHGVLVATDSTFIQVNTTNFSGAGTYQYKLLYRFKKVSLTEYIGIVQSQQ